LIVYGVRWVSPGEKALDEELLQTRGSFEAIPRE
jgi:hypothetical protein